MNQTWILKNYKETINVHVIIATVLNILLLYPLNNYSRLKTKRQIKRIGPIVLHKIRMANVPCHRQGTILTCFCCLSFFSVTVCGIFELK